MSATPKSFTIDVNSLTTFRPKEIRGILNPLLSDAQRLECSRYTKPTGDSSVVIGAYQGVAKYEHYSEWRFASRYPKIRCNYYEIWIPVDEKGNDFLLSKAYLNIYTVSETVNTPDKLLSIHCDPLESRKDSPGKYRCGPHLHIQTNSPPISRSHLALCLSNLNQVLSTRKHLNLAMAGAVEMVEYEVLRKVNDARV